ncbi:hypothetical protein PY546_18145 [Providencia stuartii]|nr:hypothetical protein [Providencia stuartii]
MKLLKNHLIIGFLFGIQIISMGAMEMSGPFWPIHLQNNSSDSLLPFALTMVYVAPHDWHHANQYFLGESW